MVEPPLFFEFLVHGIELFVVIGIAYTMYILKKIKGEKGAGKNHSRVDPNS